MARLLLRVRHRSEMGLHRFSPPVRIVTDPHEAMPMVNQCKTEAEGAVSVDRRINTIARFLGIFRQSPQGNGRFWSVSFERRIGLTFGPCCILSGLDHFHRAHHVAVTFPAELGANDGCL